MPIYFLLNINILLKHSLMIKYKNINIYLKHSLFLKFGIIIVFLVVIGYNI